MFDRVIKKTKRWRPFLRHDVVKNNSTGTNRICILFGHEVDRQLRTLCAIYKLSSGSSASKIIKQIRKNFFSSL